MNIMSVISFFDNPHWRICSLKNWFERERKREREKHQCERETSICCLQYMPDPGLNLQPMCVLWLGIELTTFWCLDNAPTNWATWPGLNVITFKGTMGLFINQYLKYSYFKVHLLFNNYYFYWEKVENTGKIIISFVIKNSFLKVLFIYF